MYYVTLLVVHYIFSCKAIHLNSCQKKKVSNTSQGISEYVMRCNRDNSRLTVRTGIFIIWLNSFFGPCVKLRMLIGCSTVRYFAIMDRPVQYAFYSGSAGFGGKMFELILIKFKENYAFTIRNCEQQNVLEHYYCFCSKLIEEKYDK